MRVRKIHAVLAVSVAVVLVAASIEVRRRAQHGLSGEPDGDLPSEGDIGSLMAEPVSSTECSAEPPAVAVAKAHAGEPPNDAEVFAEDGPSVFTPPAADPQPVPEAERVLRDEPAGFEAELGSGEPEHVSSQVESDAGFTGKRRIRGGVLAVVAAVLVLIAVLGGTVVAVAAGATSSPPAAHYRPSSLYP